MEVEFESIIKNLPEQIYNILKLTPKYVKQNAREIKLRIGKKININHNNEIFYLNKILTTEEIEEIFKAICNYSVHSHTKGRFCRFPEHPPEGRVPLQAALQAPSRSAGSCQR